ncbi:Glucanosyltransferase [Geosmithia morbida]|uniref:1,3-beta-glucanosyltransferase n=1 Tax=Geosmithia morbida TaxID=1094350 RepID=A0A9P5D3M1_9HYPO|nr:Glucanosyltransferase [Geosmithia morbida]KAF4126348.1 Glucanosyltransferase [Geosmithia morbida]
MLMKSALVAIWATAAAAVNPLKIDGRNFVDEDNNRFQIVGMAYQPGGSAGYNPKTGKDPLSHKDACLRDAALMQVLGVNAIRVYNVDPDINHDECASIFNAAGIYMMIDVNSPLVGESISSYQPWTTYYDTYVNRTFAVVEAFSNYPNTLLFFSGNEIINDVKSAADVPPYMRAITRDLKNYISKNIDRKIPVGYSAADVRSVLWDTFDYVTCALDGSDDDASRADFFALNSYSWCGIDATFTSSGYDKLVSGFKDSSVPVFFSEYGCNETPQRWFNETLAIYSDKMYNVFSGGVVYEYTQEDNDYGLVDVSGSTAKLLDDYVHLKEKLAMVDWESMEGMEPLADEAIVECSSKLITVDGFDSNFTLPDLPPNVAPMIKNGISPKPSGKIVDISSYDVTLKVEDAEGNALSDLKVVPITSANYNGKNKAETGSSSSNSSSSSSNSTDSSSADADSSSSDDDSSAAMMAMPAIWAAAVPVLAMIFA